MVEWVPEVASYEGIDVVPYTPPLLVKYAVPGGPIWPDWDRPAIGRWLRNGGPVDRKPDPVVPERHVGGHAWWIGPLHQHFGHLIAEFLPRLFATAQLDPAGRYVFAPTPQLARKGIEGLPRYMRDLFAWYDVPEEQILFVDRPTRFEALSVIAAPEHHGKEDVCAPSDAYLDLVSAHARRKLGPTTRSGSLMVSRRNYLNRVGGEVYLADLMAERGVRVICPEDYSLDEQIRIYAGAEKILFSDGSAYHCLQLSGRQDVDVVVLRRREEFEAQPVLRPRCRSLEQVMPRWPGFQLWSSQGFYRPAKGFGAHDAAGLRTCFELLGLDPPEIDRQRLHRENAEGLQNAVTAALKLPHSSGLRSSVELAATLGFGTVPGGRKAAAGVLGAFAKRNAKALSAALRPKRGHG